MAPAMRNRPSARPARRQNLGQAKGQHAQHQRQRTQNDRPTQPHQNFAAVVALPVQHRPETDQQQQRHHHRHKGQLVIGPPHRNRMTARDLDKHRIEGAQEHSRGRCQQEQIVHGNAAFARQRREQRAAFHRRRAPGKHRQRRSGGQRDDAQNVDAAPRIDREGMHAGEHAGAHQESADQAEREGQNRQQDGPADQGAAPLQRDARNAAVPCPSARASGTRSQPGPRTTSRPSPGCNRPRCCPW